MINESKEEVEYLMDKFYEYRILAAEAGANLAGHSAHRQTEQDLHALLVQDWEPAAVHARILASQRERLFLAEVANGSAKTPNWAYQPFVDETQRFIRGSGAAGPTSVKARARFPFVEPAQPD